MPQAAANPVRPNTNPTGFKIAPAKFRDALYAIVEMPAAGVPQLQAFTNLTTLAQGIHKRRGKSGLQVLDGQLAWGGGDDEARGAVTVTILDGEGDARDRLTILTQGEDARALMAELSATRSTARKAA